MSESRCAGVAGGAAKAGPGRPAGRRGPALRSRRHRRRRRRHSEQGGAPDDLSRRLSESVALHGGRPGVSRRCRRRPDAGPKSIRAGPGRAGPCLTIASYTGGCVAVRRRRPSRTRRAAAAKRGSGRAARRQIKRQRRKGGRGIDAPCRSLLCRASFEKSVLVSRGRPCPAPQQTMTRSYLRKRW